MGTPRQPEDPVRIVAAWRERLVEGRLRELDLLTTRTCRVDLSGRCWDVPVLGRERLLALARALGRGLENAAWHVDRVQQCSHRVVVDVALSARHTGPLDLSPLGGPRRAGTGRAVRVPRHRVRWAILHGRVHEVEVLHGPGFGWQPFAAEAVEPGQEDTGTNGHANGRTNPRANGHANGGANGHGPKVQDAAARSSVAGANGREHEDAPEEEETEDAGAGSRAEQLRERVDAVIEDRHA